MDLVTAPSLQANMAIVGLKVAAQSQAAMAGLVSDALENSKKIVAAASGGRGQLLDIQV